LTRIFFVIIGSLFCSLSYSKSEKLSERIEWYFFDQFPNEEQLESIEVKKGVSGGNFGYKSGYAVASLSNFRHLEKDIIAVTNANLNLVWLVNSEGDVLEKAGDLSQEKEHQIQFRFPVFNLSKYKNQSCFIVV
jgi:hypothetical protein